MSDESVQRDLMVLQRRLAGVESLALRLTLLEGLTKDLDATLVDTEIKADGAMRALRGSRYDDGHGIRRGQDGCLILAKSESDDRLVAAFDNPDDDPTNPGADDSPGTLFDKLDDDGSITIEPSVNGDGLRQVKLSVAKSPSGADLDTSAWCFGYGRATGAVVPVTPGTLWVGIPSYEYAGGNVAVANGQVIGWEWGGGSTVTVMAGAESYFVDDDAHLRGWFHKWAWAGAGHDAVPTLIGHLGNLKFPGNYAVKVGP